MVVLVSDCDAESTTTTFVSGTGTATPATEAERLQDQPEEWLLSSKQNPAFFLRNEPRSSHCIRDEGFEICGSHTVTRMADPFPDDTFLIIDKHHNRVLAWQEGCLQLEDASTMSSGDPIPAQWQWLCIEKDGFKGFKNVAEGGFLGHDGGWKNFHANAPHLKDWEFFILNKRRGGYYWIQALRWWTLWQMSARSDGRGVFGEMDGGTLWEFARIRPL